MTRLLEEKYQLQKNYSLCLIEDDSEIGNWLINKLKGDKSISSFHWVKNYRESENHLKNSTPDVIILDLKLPDGNGTDILRTIKSENPDIIVFVFTANPEFRSACLRLGADRFYDKSTDGEALLDSLQLLSV